MQNSIFNGAFESDLKSHFNRWRLKWVLRGGQNYLCQRNYILARKMHHDAWQSDQPDFPIHEQIPSIETFPPPWKMLRSPPFPQVDTQL